MASTIINNPLIGRIVQGNVWEGYKQTDDHDQPKLDANGVQKLQFYIAVAYEKSSPMWPAFEKQLYDVAALGHPQFFTPGGQSTFHGPTPGCTNPNYSCKIIDGDGRDANGQPYATKEGFAGHWVVKYSSSFAPKLFANGKYAPHEALQDPNCGMLKRGHFVKVGGSVTCNDGGPQRNKFGIYVNLQMVEHIAFGPEIVGGPHASDVFGAGPQQALPAGASLAPVGAAVAPQPPVAAATAPVAAVAPPPPVAAATAPVAAVAPPPPVPVWVPTMTPAAVAAGLTFDALKAAGWDEQQMLSSGYIVDCPSF